MREHLPGHPPAAPMMLPPDVWEGSSGEVPPYDVPRGMCVHCGSGNVIHIIAGMPTSPEVFGSGPDWMWWVGCVFEGHNRQCLACSGKWFWDEETQDARFSAFGDLLAFAGVQSTDALADWLSKRTSLAALVRSTSDDGSSADEWSVGFDEYGVELEFPMTLSAFWDLVRDQEADTLARRDGLYDT